MKILAPVNNLESAKDMIACGAGELYLGMDEELFNAYSLTGRGKVNASKSIILQNVDIVEKIVDYAHQNNCKVNLLANTQFLSSYELLRCFNEYVYNCVACKVDSIVIGDVGLLYYLKKMNINIPLHASIFFRTINVEQVRYLKTFNVDRVCLSYHVTFDEIVSICNSNIMDVEVVGFLGCSFYNGACSFLHDYGESFLNTFDPGLACKSLYNFGDEETSSPLFDAESACGICSINNLRNAGVVALKIVGREINSKQMKEIVTVFCNAVNQRKTRDSTQRVPEWWRRKWCKLKSCKYMQNTNSIYTIGM